MVDQSKREEVTKLFRKYQAQRLELAALSVGDRLRKAAKDLDESARIATIEGRKNLVSNVLDSVLSVAEDLVSVEDFLGRDRADLVQWDALRGGPRIGGSRG